MSTKEKLISGLDGIAVYEVEESVPSMYWCPNRRMLGRRLAMTSYKRTAPLPPRSTKQRGPRPVFKPPSSPVPRRTAKHENENETCHAGPSPIEYARRWLSSEIRRLKAHARGELRNGPGCRGASLLLTDLEYKVVKARETPERRRRRATFGRQSARVTSVACERRDRKGE